jgi:hypothetical protein
MNTFSDVIWWLCGLGFILLGCILLITKEIKSIKYGVLDFEGYYFLVGVVFIIAGGYMLVLTSFNMYKKRKNK